MDIYYCQIGKMCPHCRGELKEVNIGMMHYVCQRCYRGWFVKGKYWFALSDAGRHVYRLEHERREERRGKEKERLLEALGRPEEYARPKGAAG